MDQTSEPVRIAMVVGKMVMGGVETVVLNYHTFIDRSKYQFDYFIDDDIELDCEEEIVALGGRIYRVPPYQHVFQYIKVLKQLFTEHQYKIVHCHLNTLNIFPLFAAYLAHVPVRISHNHSTTAKGEWKKNIMKQCLRPFSHMFATNYFACSTYAGEWMFGKNITDSNRLQIIRNGIDIDKFKYDERMASKKRIELNLQNQFVIGHVGRFCTAKNQSFIIDLLKKMVQEQINVVFLSIGDGETLENIKEKVKEESLEQHVRFMGACRNVNEYMMAMDVFILPSLYEGLGIVAIEAQYLGLPVLASTGVPNEARISNGIEFLDLQESLEKWVNRLEVIKIKKHFEITSQEYDIKKNAIHLCTLYEHCLKGTYI